MKGKVNLYRVTFYLVPTVSTPGMSVCRGPDLTEDVFAETQDEAIKKVKQKIGQEFRFQSVELQAAQG